MGYATLKMPIMSKLFEKLILKRLKPIMAEKHNKLTLYKQVIRPVWSYGIQLWGCASESNIQVIQRYQNKVKKKVKLSS
jgi:hypothetical protein